jgi:NAD(P)H-dependent FMN reductase
MKILAFAASNSSTSINKQFVTSVAKYYKEKEDFVEIIDLRDYDVPLFSQDLEREIGTPSQATSFAAKIDGADFILISYAEHNGNYCAAYKNITDWTSRIAGRKLFNGKPVFLMATSNGARGGQSVLEIATQRLPRDGAEVLETFSLPEFSKNFEPGKGIINPLLRSQLEAKVRKTKRLMAQKLQSQDI